MIHLDHCFLKIINNIIKKEGVVLLLKEFVFKFSDKNKYPEGIMEIIKALDKSQAIMFADKVARRLDKKWGSTVNWKLIERRDNSD